MSSCGNTARSARTSAGSTEKKESVPPHDFQIGAGRRQIRECEQHPGDQDDDAGIQMGDPGRGLFQMLQQEQLFKNQDNAVEQSPENEVPGSAVPESGQQPDDHAAAY